MRVWCEPVDENHLVKLRFYVGDESALQLPHQGREVSNFPVLGQLPVGNAIELKRHHVDEVALRLDPGEITFVRAANAVQNGHKVAFGHHSRNRQLEIGESRTKPREISLESFAPGS